MASRNCLNSPDVSLPCPSAILLGIETAERLIWLDRAVVGRLRSLGGPGESYSDAIAAVGGGRRLNHNFERRP